MKQAQYYYLTRTGLPYQPIKDDDFLAVRNHSLETVTELYTKNGNSDRFHIDGEEWTLKKILRRFIWHDRIHGKAIVRILRKQASLGLVSSYHDPFGFEANPPK